MLYGISEQYPDEVVTHVLLDLIYDHCYPLHAKTTGFCFRFGYRESNNFRLIKIFDLLKLVLIIDVRYSL